MVRLTTLRLFALMLAANLAVAGSLVAGEAHACSCAGGSSPSAELESSDAVFVGKAVENGLKDPDPRDNAQFGGIRFDVSKSWKGVLEDSVVLYGQGSSYYGPTEEGETMAISSCAVDFTKGQSYLVYASRSGDDEFLQANVCGRTGSLTSAKEDLASLGPPGGELPDTGGPDWSRPSLFAALGGAAVVFSVAVIPARKRA